MPEDGFLEMGLLRLSKPDETRVVQYLHPWEAAALVHNLVTKPPANALLATNLPGENEIRTFLRGHPLRYTLVSLVCAMSKCTDKGAREALYWQDRNGYRLNREGRLFSVSVARAIQQLDVEGLRWRYYKPRRAAQPVIEPSPDPTANDP